jgi:hypothetical protein
VSVVSELRQLATDLEADVTTREAAMARHRGADHEHGRAVSIGLRLGAQKARLRALRAEHSIECRTDERPRFAVLRAPARPQAPSRSFTGILGSMINFQHEDGR